MPDAVLQVKDLQVHFPLRNNWGRVQAVVQAVRGVSFAIARGETVGLVGESGCGKSTVAKAIVRLVEPTTGRVLVNAVDWSSIPERTLRMLRPQAQMIFQDPYSSLNPRMRVGRILEEPLIIHKRGTRAERQARVAQLLEKVGLHPDDAQKYPHEFSGGQRQRIGIGRAIILDPDLLLADEAISALDVSIQAQILNLLADLQAEHGHSMLFISHDLRVVEQIADRVLVMYLGRIVESGSPEAVFDHPRHPYTRALVAAVPVIGDETARPAGATGSTPLSGEPPSPSNPPSGCAFRTRCPLADDVCMQRDPQLSGDDHQVACHHPISG